MGLASRASCASSRTSHSAAALGTKVARGRAATCSGRALAAGLVVALLGIASCGAVARFYHEPAVRASSSFSRSLCRRSPGSGRERPSSASMTSVRSSAGELATTVRARWHRARRPPGLPVGRSSRCSSLDRDQSALVWVRSPGALTRFRFAAAHSLGFSGMCFGQRLLSTAPQHRQPSRRRFLVRAALCADGHRCTRDFPFRSTLSPGRFRRSSSGVLAHPRRPYSSPQDGSA